MHSILMDMLLRLSRFGNRISKHGKSKRGASHIAGKQFKSRKILLLPLKALGLKAEGKIPVSPRLYKELHMGIRKDSVRGRAIIRASAEKRNQSQPVG